MTTGPARHRLWSQILCQQSPARCGHSWWCWTPSPWGSAPIMPKQILFIWPRAEARRSIGAKIKANIHSTVVKQSQKPSPASGQSKDLFSRRHPHPAKAEFCQLRLGLSLLTRSRSSRCFEYHTSPSPPAHFWDTPIATAGVLPLGWPQVPREGQQPSQRQGEERRRDCVKSIASGCKQRVTAESLQMTLPWRRRWPSQPSPWHLQLRPAAPERSSSQIHPSSKAGGDLLCQQDEAQNLTQKATLWFMLSAEADGKAFIVLLRNSWMILSLCR